MLKKLILFIFTSAFLLQCGFTPLHSTKDIDLGKFSVENIDLAGDKTINNYIKINFTKFKNKKKDKVFVIKGETIFYKDILSKDKSANVTDYQLSVKSIIKIFSKNNLVKEIKITEEKNMNNMSDKFEEQKYENTIKKIFASSISKKVITELSLLNDS